MSLVVENVTCNSSPYCEATNGISAKSAKLASEATKFCGHQSKALVEGLAKRLLDIAEREISVNSQLELLVHRRKFNFEIVFLVSHDEYRDVEVPIRCAQKWFAFRISVYRLSHINMT